MCPLIISTACGQYLAAFDYVSPIHVSKIPLFIDLSQIGLNGNPDATCMYRTSTSVLGIS